MVTKLVAMLHCDHCGRTVDGEVVTFVYAAGGYLWMCKKHDLCRLCVYKYGVGFGAPPAKTCPVCLKEQATD